MVSNDLLSAVMGYKCYVMTAKYIHFLNNSRVNDIVYERGSELQYNINMYELANKCKEWAFTNNIRLVSGISVNDNSQYFCSLYNNTDITYKMDFLEAMEPEAIFKACEWILNHKGLQCLQL